MAFFHTYKHTSKCFSIEKTLRRTQSNYFFPVEILLGRKNSSFELGRNIFPCSNTVELFFLDRKTPRSNSVETFFLVRTQSNCFFLIEKLLGRTRSKSFSLVEHSRNVFSRSKFFSVKKTHRSNSVETFFRGRTQSNFFFPVENSSVKLGRNIFLRSNLVKKFFLVET